MHDIWGDRFANHREPAWHGLGLTIKDRKVGAVEAFNLMGAYSLRTESLFTKAGLDASRQAIIREATTKGEKEIVLGTVGPDYKLITPMEACSIYDVAVEEPIETIGVLREGALLFITVALPHFDVKGDEVQDYLLLVNPMDGLEAAKIVRSPVRTVCMNTLRLGLRLGQIQYRIRHDNNAKKQMHDWLKEVYAKAVGQAEVIKEACEILANYRVSTTEVANTLNAVYPDPKTPRNTAPLEVMKKRMEHRSYIAELQSVAREQVKILFDGKGKGMDTVAAAGSAWGLMNSIVEYEDYRWAKNPTQALESAMFGSRADVKDVAFEECAALAGVK